MAFLAFLAVVGPIVSGVLTYRAATGANKVTEAANIDTHTRESSKSDREILLEAMALSRSDNPAEQRQGDALLAGMLQMPGLSPDDAVLVLGVTRPIIEPTLSEVRERQVREGKVPGFVRRLLRGDSE